MPKPKRTSRKGVAGRPKSAKSSENSETEEEEARKYHREKMAEYRGQVLKFIKFTSNLIIIFS